MSAYQDLAQSVHDWLAERLPIHELELRATMHGTAVIVVRPLQYSQRLASIHVHFDELTIWEEMTPVRPLSGGFVSLPLADPDLLDKVHRVIWDIDKRHCHKWR
jgi:hypothetical protein